MTDNTRKVFILIGEVIMQNIKRNITAKSLQKTTFWMPWICTGKLCYMASLFMKCSSFCFTSPRFVTNIRITFSREKYQKVVFVYISDDLIWGKEKLERKARNRKLDIHFVGDNASTDQRDRDRNRYPNLKNLYIQISYNAIFIEYLFLFSFLKLQYWS